MFRSRRKVLLAILAAFIALAVSSFLLVQKQPQLLSVFRSPESSGGSSAAKKVDVADQAQPVVEINEKGLDLLKVGSVTLRDFEQEIRDVGVIDFNQDATVAVFPSYQGKIIAALVDLGDHVDKNQILYTIDSPDLVQAESTMIQTAGVLELATKNVGRLRQSVKNGGGAQKDLDQAQSDLQTAVGAYNSARKALEIFGKTGDEADRIAASRTVDPVLEVRSPFAGTITARNATPGEFVQPGTAPAPYTMTDPDHVRMYDFVSEAESPAIRLGEEVTGRVTAYPDRLFTGKVTAIAAALDPGTHRLQVESLIPDPKHLLRPSMFAELRIRTGAPERSPAVPADAVVRLGDGAMTVWVATRERRFTQRVVKIGLQQDGFDQIVEGLQPGEAIVTEGAVYVSNIANANATP